MHEQGISFAGAQGQLIGVLHHAAVAEPSKGVVIIVGGPQTRVGSHRQFVHLARYLAAKGMPVLRFDYAGMGDSEGLTADFLNNSEDIAAAIHFFKQQTQVQHVVLWGLCDAASAMLIYAAKKSTASIAGMVLLNPWVRSEKTQAKTRVKHYYLARLKSREFWQKVCGFKLDLRASIQDIAGYVKILALSWKKNSRVQTGIASAQQTTEENYIEHMRHGLNKFNGAILLITSGNDLTAAEFLDLVAADKGWQEALEKKVSKKVAIETANHTFSSKAWRAKVEAATYDWITQLN